MTVPHEAPAASEERPATPQPMRLRALGWTLVGVSVALSVASMAVPALIHHPLTRNRGEIQVYLDVFEEGNLPTWWSTGLLVAAALLHAIVGLAARTGRTRGAWAWFITASVLGVLSLDDHTALHERLGRIGKQWVDFDGFPGYWLLPGLFAAGVVVAGFAVLASRLTGAGRWYLIGGCALLLASAMGGEALQGLWVAVGESGPIYVLTYHAEELGENFGVLLLMAAAFQSLTVTRGDGRLSLAYRHLSLPPAR